jgi:hypothetical protein
MNAPPHMFKAIVSASLISLSIAGCSNPLPSSTVTSRYVPGLSCNDVAGFAQNVATQRSQGVDLLDQFDAIEDNYSDNPQAVDALKGIARGIYRTGLKNEPPASVGAAYQRECALTNKTR